MTNQPTYPDASAFADILMRGRIVRAGMQEFLDEHMPERGAELAKIDGPAIMMIDRGITLVVPVREVV